MKRFIITIITIILIILTLSSCGNMGMGIGNYTYRHLHINTYHYEGCYTIEKWYDNANGIEVKTVEVGSLFLSEGTYVLIGEKEVCPFCNKKGE